ncbi:unnamed protein product, partial [Arabidopsis halleri]
MWRTRGGEVEVLRDIASQRAGGGRRRFSGQTRGVERHRGDGIRGNLN